MPRFMSVSSLLRIAFLYVISVKVMKERAVVFGAPLFLSF